MHLKITFKSIFIFILCRFLATGDSMRTIAFSCRLGHTTVWSIIKEVCNVIVKKMMEEKMPIPKKKGLGRNCRLFLETLEFS
jgi:tRNA(Phe) wybutosine-synthesizing methylase Tyw3